MQTGSDAKDAFLQLIGASNWVQTLTLAKNDHIPVSSHQGIKDDHTTSLVERLSMMLFRNPFGCRRFGKGMNDHVD